MQTSRLSIRPLSLDDAGFILTLLNEPSFLENIGDRGVRTLQDAEVYLRDGPLDSYAHNGFGLSAVVESSSHTLIGICGILRREALPEPDLGYALLPQFTGLGYALEAAQAWVQAGRTHFGLTQLLAIVNASNQRSIRLLEKLGFKPQHHGVLDHHSTEATATALAPELLHFQLNY